MKTYYVTCEINKDYIAETMQYAIYRPLSRTYDMLSDMSYAYISTNTYHLISLIGIGFYFEFEVVI